MSMKYEFDYAFRIQARIYISLVYFEVTTIICHIWTSNRQDKFFKNLM